jgi:chromate transporter
MYLFGTKHAIFAAVFGAVVPLAKKSVESLQLAVIGIVVLYGSLLIFFEIYLLLGVGLIALFIAFVKNQKIIPSITLLVASVNIIVAVCFNMAVESTSD